MSACKNSPDFFCVICGEYVFARNRKPLSDLVKQNYENCFGKSTKKLNNYWTPKTVCSYCVSCFSH